MVQVVWSRRALRDLADIVSSVGADRPLAADRLGQRLMGAGNSLDRFPLRGRERGGLRENVSVRPYIIRYLVTPGRVSIVTIRHGARRPD